MVSAARIRKLELAIPTPPDREELSVPDLRPINIIDFVTNPTFLGQNLYPRQATALKALSLSVELFTDYDHRVLSEWAAGYSPDDAGSRWEGAEGTTPDVLERIDWCRTQGRMWFREATMVIGRRGSKGVMGAVMAAWQLWKLIEHGDPQSHFGIAAGKRLEILVFAGKQDQAATNQFGDIAALVRDAPCFAPYIDKVTTNKITLYTPHQLKGGRRTSPLIEVRAVETTQLGPRGPAVLTLILDEIAHVVGAGSTASAAQLYTAATPALAQFPTDAFIYQASSPWEKTGQLWDSYCQACSINPSTGQAVHPDMFVLQLPSWGTYKDWKIAAELPMWPGGPTFMKQARAVIELDDALLRQEAANPESFRVEYRAQFASSLSAYLRPEMVAGIFAPFQGKQLVMQTAGNLATRYVAHADPSESQANFGFAIGHLVYVDDIPHVVFDVIDVWRPGDFPNHIVDYIQIEGELTSFVDRFSITKFTFDQFGSAGAIQRLQLHAQTKARPVPLMVSKRHANHNLNWQMAETFKTAAGHGLIHAPPHLLAMAELEYLQRTGTTVAHPNTGPIRTDDVADCLINVVWSLIGDAAPDIFSRLTSTELKPSRPPSINLIAQQFSQAGKPAPYANSYNPARGISRNRRRR